MTETNDAKVRELIVMRAGAHAFGVFAWETDGAIEFKNLAPLPFAPPSVLGVVAARGRMRTLINPLALIEQSDGAEQRETQSSPTPRLALLLRGDEQLALAVETVEPPVEISTDAILPADPPLEFSRGAITLDGTRVLILNPTRLFNAAMRGAERRRQR